MSTNMTPANIESKHRKTEGNNEPQNQRWI